MRKLVAGALALGLLSACADSGQASDTIAKACDEYAAAVEVGRLSRLRSRPRPWRSSTRPTPSRRWSAHSARPRGHYSAAVTAWAARKGLSHEH
jgi:hypothetical protein